MLPQPSLQTSPIPRGKPDSPQTPEVPSPPSDRFLVKKVEVLGNTVLHKQIADLIKPFENSEVTFEELIGLRSAITQLYINNGYVTSGAFLLNNQALSSGVVQIQVVEGELERIELSGLRRLREGYVRSRIALAATKPLNRRRIEEGLQLLQLDPLIAQVNAELSVGSTPGRNILQIRLREAPAFHARISTENRQSPSIGCQETSLSLAHDNLLVQPHPDSKSDRLESALALVVRVELVGESEESVVEESELDEMWSFVGNKRHPRWLWQAIDHRTGRVLAYAFGRRQDEVVAATQKVTETFWD